MPAAVDAKNSEPDLPFALPDITRMEIEGVVECLESGWLTAGRKVREFEQAFAERVGARFAISCSSATMGALLLLEALGVGPGTDVIVPTWTFSGPAMMAHKLGAQVVLADVHPVDFNLTCDTLASCLTTRAKVVMPTHFAGRSCDMAALAAFCRAHGLVLIDDAAHAFPATDDAGRMVGAQGARATFFSFYATKTLTTGEGGMVVTDDEHLAHRLRARRCHGIGRDVFDRYTNPATGWRYDVGEPGWKANMTDLSAALGLAQLARSHEMLVARTLIARIYHAALEEAELMDRVTRPALAPGHAWHLYPLLVRGGRDRFVALMAERGVQCSVHFVPLQEHSFWRRKARNGHARFPSTEYLAAQEVSLPIYSKLTRAEAERVAAAVISALDLC